MRKLIIELLMIVAHHLGAERGNHKEIKKIINHMKEGNHIRLEIYKVHNSKKYEIKVL